MTSEKPISRQALHQQRLVAEGRCIRCGIVLTEKVTQACIPCNEKRLEHIRQQRGHKAWTKGGRGRPPKIAGDKPDQSAIEALLLKVPWEFNNNDLAKYVGVSINTIRKYRKIYAPNTQGSRIQSFILEKADWSKTNKELSEISNICVPTVQKYRKIYAP